MDQRSIFHNDKEDSLKVLELYSGTQSIGKEFRKKGHKVISVELNDTFTKPPYNYDQWTMSVADLKPQDIIDELNGRPDFIWASPPCTTHSIAAISTHRQQGEDGLLYAKSDKAKEHDLLLLKTIQLIQELKPKYWFIENPRGGMRKSPLMQGMMFRYTVTYCSYGDNSMKPTDIWTNYPNPEFKEMCFNGNTNCHHQSAPRGSKTGTQGKKGNLERSIIPQELCKHIVNICEEEKYER
jgi:site-specific DNA-cytosine methylase